MFQGMEGQRTFESVHLVHLVYFHIICKPLLIKTIECFAQGWNNYYFNKEHNETPTRLFHGKLIEFWNADGCDCNFLRQVSVLVLKKYIYICLYY
jgi:hypothetical protein